MYKNKQTTRPHWLILFALGCCAHTYINTCTDKDGPKTFHFGELHTAVVRDCLEPLDSFMLNALSTCRYFKVSIHIQIRMVSYFVVGHHLLKFLLSF